MACQLSKTKSKEQNKQSDASIVQETEADKTDMPAYFQAALNGDLDKIQEGINQGIDVNAKDENMHSALMLAAYNGHHHVLSFLIEKGAEIDAVDGMNRTALMFACTGPFTKAAELLIDAGANVNAIDSQEEWTPVMMAAAEGQLEVVQLLVAKGADLSMVDEDGESSLDFAQSNGHTKVVEYIQSQLK